MKKLMLFIGVFFTIINITLAQSPYKLEFVQKGIRGIMIKNENIAYSLNGGTIYKTINAGYDWNPIMTDILDKTSSESISSLHVFNDTEAIITTSSHSYEKSYIYKTVDGGKTWNLKYETFPSTLKYATKGVYNINFLDENTGWVLGKGLILKTEDRGENWEISYNYHEISSNADYYLKSFFSDNKNGWVVGFGATILKTEDGGENWKYQNVDTSSLTSGYIDAEWFYISGCDFIDDKIGFATSYNGNFYRTVDGGENWLKENNGFVHDNVGVTFSDENTVWLVGGDYCDKGCYNGQSIIYSLDQGINWNSLLDTTDNSLSEFGQIVFFTPNLGYAVTGKSELYRITKETTTSLEEKITNSIKCFPNPVSDELFINYEGNKPLSFDLTDLTGKVIYSKKGSNGKLKLDTSKLPSGTYIIRCEDYPKYNTKIVK